MQETEQLQFLCIDQRWVFRGGEVLALEKLVHITLLVFESLPGRGFENSCQALDGEARAVLGHQLANLLDLGHLDGVEEGAHCESAEWEE